MPDCSSSLAISGKQARTKKHAGHLKYQETTANGSAHTIQCIIWGMQVIKGTHKRIGDLREM